MNLAEIRARDKAAIARLGDPANDPLLQAEMDRRFLLNKVDELAATITEGIEHMQALLAEKNA